MWNMVYIHEICSVQICIKVQEPPNDIEMGKIRVGFWKIKNQFATLLIDVFVLHSPADIQSQKTHRGLH